MKFQPNSFNSVQLTERTRNCIYLRYKGDNLNQSRTNGPINAHLTIAQVMPKYNHNNEKQEALL